MGQAAMGGEYGIHDISIDKELVVKSLTVGDGA